MPIEPFFMKNLLYKTLSFEFQSTYFKISYFHAHKDRVVIFTFISSRKDGKPPMDRKVMKPEMNPAQAPLAKIELRSVPRLKNIVPTQTDNSR